MTEPNHIPHISIDAAPIVGFASADRAMLDDINKSQGLSISQRQYTYLQQNYLTKQRKHPTIGELLLIDRITSCFSPADTYAPGEILCTSPLLMETWADIVHAHHLLTGETAPCTMSQILDLPKALLLYRGLLSETNCLPRITTATIVSTARKGYLPTREITSPKSTSAWLWEATSVKGESNVFRAHRKSPSPRPGDALVFVPNTHPTDIREILEQSALRSMILDDRLVAAPSLTRVALSLCGSCGLDIQMNTFLRSVSSPQESRMRIYLDVCETACQDGLCHVLIRVPATKEKHVISSLISMGIPAFHYGNLTKEQRLTMMDGSLKVVNLKTELLAAPFFPTLVSYALSDPTPLSAASTSVSFSHLKDAALVLSHGQVCITDPEADGFTPAVHGVLSAVGALASIGIPYSHVHLSVSVAFQGKESSPILLSALCGLYRIATELGLPIEDANITLTPPQSDAQSTLRLTVYAYAPVTNETPAVLSPSLITEAEEFSSLFSYDTLSSEKFDLIRTLLGAITEKAKENNPSAQKEQIPPLTVSPLPHPSAPSQPQSKSIKRKEATSMNNIREFESLSRHPRQVLLDTDIGPDCDDVGALVTLIHYAKQYNFPIIGVCNCTSNRAGNGLIDLVSRRCGVPTPPMGQWSKPNFMNQPEYCKYSNTVAEKFSEGYRNEALEIEDEVTFYRRRLAAAPDGEVMIISIGMFNNLAALLESPADNISPLTGMELVKAKVHAMVSMAAILPEGRECNVLCDYASAKAVFDNWPTPIYFSDFNIGFGIKTGYKHITDPEAIQADPLVLSYHLYTRDWPVVGDNDSYDLAAVQFAVLGDCDLYGLDVPGRLEFYAAMPDRPDLPDATRFVPDPAGNRIFMTLKVSKDEVAKSLNQILHNI